MCYIDYHTMNNKEFDVAVIGGGPAGLMAAGTAAKKGAKVVLLEKNEQPGKKLLITGGGRCNITTAETDPAKFVAAFGKNGKFLYPAFHAFSIDDTIRFFNQQGLATKVETRQRVLPVSDRAQDVLQVLLNYLKKHKVETINNCTVTKLVKKQHSIEKIQTNHGYISAKQAIVCVGGRSYPATGSVGDGYKWAQSLGHTVVTPQPALVPLKTKERWIEELAGLSLKDLHINVYQGKKQLERSGEALFTHQGLSGPIILDMSQEIGALLNLGKVELRLDFKPELNYEKLDQKLQEDFRANANKLFRNSLSALLPNKLIPVIIQLSEIDPNKKVNLITKEERKKLLHLLKEFTVNVQSLDGFSKAVTTSGGINLKEIDPRSMRSKIIKNLSLAGEIIDLNGPTGGYNLQMCWSTGYLAGSDIQ